MKSLDGGHIGVFDVSADGSREWLYDIRIETLVPGDLLLREDGLVLMLMSRNKSFGEDYHWDVQYIWCDPATRGGHDSDSWFGSWWSDTNMGVNRFFVISRG